MKWNWQQPDWPNWSFDPGALKSLEDEFLLKSGRLSGIWQHLTTDNQEQLKINFLSGEALKTSEIEGEYLDRASVQSSIRRQFGLKVKHKSGSAENGIAKLMTSCFAEFNKKITHKMLFDWHRLIFQGASNELIIGGYRKHTEPMQVVSGAIHRPKVHFEALPSKMIKSEMTNFLRWIENTEPDGINPLPPLTRAGLAHLYFVSIHPFKDGNGRIARALSEKLLAQFLNQPSLIALSYQIEKDRKYYYQHLEANNKQMEITDWLVWFAKTVLKAQKHSTNLIENLIAKTKLFDRLYGKINARQEKVLLRLFQSEPDGFAGGLSAKNYRTITGTSPATTRRDLVDLVNKDALKRTGELKGTRYWLNI